MRWIRSRLIQTFFGCPDVYPTGFFSGVRNPFLNKIRMRFWTLIVKKQKKYQDFYRNYVYAKNPTLTDITSTQEDAPKFLKEYGIALVKDVLNKDELDEFISISKDHLSQAPKQIIGDSVIAERAKVLNRESQSTTKLINIANNIFNESICKSKKENIHIHIQRLTKPINKRDLNDTNSEMHSDKFIPTIKIFFYPFGVELGHSQFEFIPYTHLINSDFYKSYDDFYDKVSTGKNTSYACSIKNPTNQKSLKLAVPPNSLVICATNGIHRRSKFEDSLIPQETQRLSAHLLLYSQQKKISLINQFFNF